MKYIYSIPILLTIALCTGCSDDDYESPNPELTDVTWYTSIAPGTPAVRSIGEYISFLDASQGLIDHEWEIEEGSKFLKDTFRPQDSLPLFIDDEIGLISMEPTVHVVFQKQGINKVTLRNTFDKPVVYQGDTPISSTEANGVHIFENTFEIDVYDSLKPAFKVFNGPTEVLNITGADLPQEEDSADWPTLTIEAGTKLTYVDMTTYDRPNARAWGLTRASAANVADSVVTAAYFKLGTTAAGFFRSIREGNLPNENVFKFIPLNIEVIPSTAPFRVDDAFEIIELEDERIAVSLTGEVELPVGQEGNFTVRVTNPNGFDAEIPVRTVSVDLEDATKLILALDAPIFNTDTIEVSFADGTITSVDNRTLENFGPLPAKSYTENLYPADVAGLEAGRGDWVHETWAAGPSHTFVTAPDPVFEGDFAIRFEALTSGAVFTSNKSIPINFEAGKRYGYNYKLWIDPASTATAFGNVRNPPFAGTDLQIGDYAKGEWIDSGDIFYDGDGEESIILFHMFNNDGSGAFGSGSLIIYVDNLLLYEVEERL